MEPKIHWVVWKPSGNKPDGTIIYYGEGYGLSTATKPTDVICTGSSIVEIDTSKMYFYSEELQDWLEFGVGG